VEAKARIIEAAMRCIDRYGASKTGLSDVAKEVGVIRQTVYRYFPSTEELFAAVSRAGVDNFMDRLAAHVATITDPADLLVEAMAYTIEQLRRDRYLGLLLTTGRPEGFMNRAATAQSMDFGLSLLSRLKVDWTALGYAEGERTELVEFMLRILLSIVAAPVGPDRDGAELRAFLRRWVVPSVVLHVNN
jgi:AcrR family transcriptional regulator